MHPQGRARARARGLPGDTVPRKRLSVTPAPPLYPSRLSKMLPNEVWPTGTPAAGEVGRGRPRSNPLGRTERKGKTPRSLAIAANAAVRGRSPAGSPRTEHGLQGPQGVTWMQGRRGRGWP